MNPTGQPFTPQFGGTPPPPGGAAREALNVPSLLLLIFGVLGILATLSGLVTGGQMDDQWAKALQDPNLTPELKELFRKVAGIMTGKLVIALNALFLVARAIGTFGAWQMRNLKMYPLAVLSCILAMAPGSNCCCCITLPIGIWALTVLMKPEVKAAFT